MKALILISIVFLALSPKSSALQILSKSKLEKCEKASGPDPLDCTSKIVLDLAVPSESSGREASLVAEIVEAEENSSDHMRTLRVPPIVTINKSAAYALYELTYIRDVAYKPQEFYVKTRKCEPDAGADIVQICQRQVTFSLRDENGHIIEHTQPTCCPCGDQRRVPSSCGNFFDKLVKGKANTAHCLRFTDDWFHVFGIGQRSVGFSIRIEVKTESRTSEVIVGPENRTAISSDKFLRVNMVGDYVGYTNIPSFDDFYLVVPRQGGPGQPQNLGSNFSMWMLLERVRFTLDGLECNKIGVDFEAFNAQPDFCAAPFWSCLHNQLWNFWDADQNRVSRNQVPLYRVQGRFERINQHPNAGSHAFSIGITEILNTNLLIELRADDIDYVYQRSPGKILGITVPTFEALTQFGTATITTKNVGEVEASYSLTFDCSSGVSQMEEQFYIMKPKEVLTRSFKLYPTTDQAARYACKAILKDSDFGEVDRAECQFTTTATVLENGSQIPFQPPETSVHGFFGSIKEMWRRLWTSLADFVTGKNCRSKCSGFFDFSCHIQYVCMSWILMFGLFLAIFPTAALLIWLLHEKGLFDPIYDWWEDHVWTFESKNRDSDLSLIHLKRRKHRHEQRHHNHNHHRHKKHETHMRRPLGEADYSYYLHHVNKDRHKHAKHKRPFVSERAHLNRVEYEKMGHHHRRRKERHLVGSGESSVNRDEYSKNKKFVRDDRYW
ncbi:hapless 2 [Striga asiatica]|uniref:Hapless 2 n=1 Tax=Striga asiatica TaxID=4170 RepID=A0A5A7PCT6_STRAF|nr:hapless 2 [Striga asiatica]